MTATNHLGYHVEALDNRMGWRRASKIVPTALEADNLLADAVSKAAADAAARGTVDTVERRSFESLAGFHD